MIDHVFGKTSIDEMGNSSAAMGGHGDEVAANPVGELKDAFLRVGVVNNIKRVVLQHEAFGKGLQSFQGNIVGSKIQRRVDPYNVQVRSKKVLQGFDLQGEVFLVFGVKCVGEYNIFDRAFVIFLHDQDRCRGVADDSLCIGSNKKFTRTAGAMGAHHHQVDALFNDIGLDFCMYRSEFN